MIKNILDFFLRHKLISIVFLIGFIYVSLPGPGSIDDFPGLNNSIKSALPGDSWQRPNIAAYFSDYRRDNITEFYKNFFGKTIIPGVSLPFIKVNHRPEEAYQYVRQYQESTFLEEYIFPLRESIYVNGHEPLIENKIHNIVANDKEGDMVSYEGIYYNSKTTLRYYPSNVFLRIFAYLGIWVAIFGIKEVTVKLIKEK